MGWFKVWSFNSTHFERFVFWPLLSDFRKIKNGLEKKLLDHSGWNFLCDVCWHIGKPRKKYLLLGQLLKKSGHPIVYIWAQRMVCSQVLKNLKNGSLLKILDDESGDRDSSQHEYQQEGLETCTSYWCPDGVKLGMQIVEKITKRLRSR